MVSRGENLQEDHLNNYVKGESSQGPGRTNSSSCDGTKYHRPKKQKERYKQEDDKVVCDMLKIIARGFSIGGETRFARRRYAYLILNIEDLSKSQKEGKTKNPDIDTTFSKKQWRPYGHHRRYDNWEI